MNQSKGIRITDVRIAVAKECLLYGDSSKQTITTITKAYLKQLKLDGFYIQHWKYEKPPTQTDNATKVQFCISKLKNERRANNTKKKLRNASKTASRSSATKKNKKRRL